MINSISGTITHKGNSSVFVENGGVEWEIITSSKTISALPDIGSKGRVLTYLNYTENSLSLFGFSDEQERMLFLTLIKINGIGPKQAVKILSTVSANDFIDALDREDTALLSGIPGIGQKTALKIILSMRGKLVKEVTATADSPFSDIIKALSDMGFDYKKAHKVVSELAANKDVKSLSTFEQEKVILKEAIVALSSAG